MTHRCLSSFALAALAVIALPVLDAQTRPVPFGTTSVDLAVDGERIHLLTAEYQDGVAVLVHRTSDDAGATWSPARSIEPSRGEMNDPSRNNDPQIAASGQHLSVVWSSKGTSAWGAGPLESAFSTDGGRTWTRGARINDDGSTDEHAFVDVTADGKG